MALTLSNELKPSNSTAALFRAWTKFVRDGFTAGGWVQTSDTGQIDFATVSAPAAINTKQGYVILRMDDALQATKPVFIRIDFGSGGAAANASMWVTAGTGSNGSGTITGQWFADKRSVLGSSSTATTSFFSHVSAGTSYAAVALWYDVTLGSFCLHLSIERGKDAAGDDDGDMLLFSSTSGLTLDQFVTVSAGVVNGAVDIAILISGGSQAQQSDVGIGVPIPHKLVSNGTEPSPLAGFERAAPPGLGYVVLKGQIANEWLFGAVVTVYMYGIAHKYIRLANGSFVTNTAHIAAIRYDG